jgi:hypothetical protein
LVAFLAAAAAAWLLCIVYALKFNPEIKYDVQSAQLKDRWARKMEAEHGSKILIYGGSSCAFSIDGERMLDRFGLPTVNYGREASMGAAVLTESVLAQARAGDTLIVAIEPGLLTGPVNLPADGVQFSFAMHHPEWVLHPALGVDQAGWFQALSALRPGGTLVFTYLGKIASGKPLMRYHDTDFRPSGFEQTSVRLPILGPAGHGPGLSADGRKLLGNLRAWCDEHRARLAYSLPWSYSPPDKKRSFQSSNIDFLLQINEFMPVLRDASLGACTNLDFYADTVWHLTGPGSAARTDSLGIAVKDWEVWTPEALRAAKVQLGEAEGTLPASDRESL